MGYRQASGEETKGGVQPGKTMLWVVRVEESGFFWRQREVITSGYLLYDNLDEALADMGRQLKFHGGQYCVVNHKIESGEELHTWMLESKIRKRVK